MVKSRLGGRDTAGRCYFRFAAELRQVERGFLRGEYTGDGVIRKVQLQRAARVLGGEQVLVAGVDPLDRAPEAPGHRGNQHLLAVGTALDAEAAADVGGDDPQLGLGDAEDEGGEGQRADSRASCELPPPEREMSCRSFFGRGLRDQNSPPTPFERIRRAKPRAIGTRPVR